MPSLVINKQYSDPVPPTAGQLDAAFDSLEVFFNVIGIGADNITDDSLTGVEFNNSAFTETKLAQNSISTSSVQDSTVTVAKLTTAVVNALAPIGSVQAYMGDTAPSGWLMCDGSPVSRITFARLFTITGTRFGEGDGVSTFNVPDTRGRFLRGTDLGANRDPDVAGRTAMNPGGATGTFVGSVEDDALAPITVPIYSHYDGVVGPGPGYPGVTILGDAAGSVNPGWPIFKGVVPPYDAGFSYGARAFDFLSDPDAGSHQETRPKNVYCNYLIKI